MGASLLWVAKRKSGFTYILYQPIAKSAIRRVQK